MMSNFSIKQIEPGNYAVTDKNSTISVFAPDEASARQSYEDSLKPPAAPSLEMLKRETHSQMMQQAEDLRQKLTGGASQLEIASWANKAERAHRVIAGTALKEEIDILQLEADSRGFGETIKDLAQRQVEKERQFATAVSLIDGWQSRTLNEIASAQNMVELDEASSKASESLETLAQKLSGS